MFIARPVRSTKVAAQAFLSGCLLLALAGTLLYFGRPRGQTALATATQPPDGQALVVSDAKSRALANFSDVPLAFERNDGQADPEVKFLARGRGYTVFLTPADTVVSLHGGSRAQQTHSPAASANRSVDSVIRMQLVGANPKPRVRGEDKLPGISNYFIGNDPKNWQTTIPQYARISYYDVYPGIGLAFHGEEKRLEFDFLVSAGANPGQIAMRFAGANRAHIDDSGALVLSSTVGDLYLRRPVVYQETSGVRQPVDGRFVIKGNQEIAFALGTYDAHRQLVIDPSLSYSTYLGGSGDDKGQAIAVDSNGNAYVTGEAGDSTFPHTTSVAFAGGLHDAFVAAFNSSGSRRYSTFIGGMSDDDGLGIAVDSSGNAYVIGNTQASSSFPATTTIGVGGMQDVFVAKFDSTGAKVWATVLGGSGIESGNAIAVDSSGNTYIAGETNSMDFPTMGPISGHGTNAGLKDAFIAKLRSDGTALTYSTYLGGSADDVATGIAVDSSANAYVTGITLSTNFPVPGGFQPTCGSCSGGLDDGFVAKIDPTGSTLLYSSFLGGTSTDNAEAIAVDSTGAAYVTGLTQSSNLPPAGTPAQAILKGSQNAFIAKVAPSGASLVFTTYLGGTVSDQATGIALDSSKNVYVTGRTSSPDFPSTSGLFTSLNGLTDAFVTELAASGSSFTFSTYLGGSGSEDLLSGGISTDPCADIYITGDTNSANFPTQASFPASQSSYGGGSADAFVVKIAPSTACFTLSTSAPSPNPVSKGSSATSTITLNAQSGVTATVALTCTAAAGITCTLNPASVSAASPTSTLTINVSSTASLGSPRVTHRSTPFYALWLPIPGLALIGIGFGSVRPMKRGSLGLLLGCLLLAGLVLQMACGSSSSSSSGGGGSTPYTVNVAGTGGGQTNSVAVSGNFQ